MERAEFIFDEREAIEEWILEYGHIAEEMARIHAEELKALLVDSAEPSPPGQPPHSEGPLRDSIYTTPARRRRGHPNEVVAYTASDLLVGEGIPLLVLLDAGGEGLPARPVLDQAELNAGRRIDEAVGRSGAG